MKKDRVNKNTSDVEGQEVSLMEKCYNLGNFFQSRKIAHILLGRKGAADDKGTKRAKVLLKMTGIDYLTLLFAVLALFFILSVAFLARYQ